MESNKLDDAEAAAAVHEIIKTLPRQLSHAQLCSMILSIIYTYVGNENMLAVLADCVNVAVETLNDMPKDDDTKH